MTDLLHKGKSGNPRGSREVTRLQIRDTTLRPEEKHHAVVGVINTDKRHTRRLQVCRVVEI